MQGMVQYPTYRECKDMISNKLLPNYPITTHDITNVNSIFGPDLADLGGKIDRKKHLYQKCKELYSCTCRYVKSRVAITLVRATHHCIRGVRVPASYTSVTRTQ